MVSLDEMRRWARGEHVQGLPRRTFQRERAPERRDPDRKHMRKFDAARMAERHKAEAAKFAKAPLPSHKYKISAEGNDALVKFGKHHGKTLGVIREEDPTYLDFIIREEFPDDLKDVARHQRSLLRKRRR